MLTTMAVLLHISIYASGFSCINGISIDFFLHAFFSIRTHSLNRRSIRDDDDDDDDDDHKGKKKYFMYVSSTF